MVESNQTVTVSTAPDTELQRKFDWREVHPTTAIIETVAAARGRSELELEPLGEQVPTDAIDNLFRPEQGSVPEYSSVIEVTLDYSGYRVTVSGDGSVLAHRTQPTSD